MEYPLVVVDSIDKAKILKDKLAKKFPLVGFIEEEYSNKFCVVVVTNISDDLYFKVYQYAQKIFVEME